MLDNHKNWKLPNGEAEAVTRRTDNAIAKRKGTKRQTMVYKTLSRTQMIEQSTQTPLNTDENLATTYVLI